MIWVQHVKQEHGLDLFAEDSNRPNTDFLFCLMTYGKCVYWVDDKKVVLEKGDALLIPGGSPYYSKGIPTVFHSKYIAAFSLSPSFPSLPVLNTSQCLHAKLGAYDLVHERMKAMHRQWIERQPYREIYASALLTEIVTLWNRELDRGSVPSDTYKHAEAMKRYIQEHYRDKITKDDLAHAIRRSPNYAASLFSKVTGQTISEYVHALRIKTAIYMISESDLTIGEIAEFLGYSDVSYFNKTFKRITGKPPSDYS
jgi:AraC family transcriptional activator of pobA